MASIFSKNDTALYNTHRYWMRSELEKSVLSHFVLTLTEQLDSAVSAVFFSQLKWELGVNVKALN